MTKLHEVVRWVEVKDMVKAANEEGRSHFLLAKAHNALASAEVVVDMQIIKKYVMSTICSRKCIGFAEVDCTEPENAEYFCDEVEEIGEVCAQAIVTAIKNKEIISLKEKE